MADLKKLLAANLISHEEYVSYINVSKQLENTVQELPLLSKKTESPHRQEKRVSQYHLRRHGSGHIVPVDLDFPGIGDRRRGSSRTFDRRRSSGRAFDRRRSSSRAFVTSQLSRLRRMSLLGAEDEFADLLQTRRRGWQRWAAALGDTVVWRGVVAFYFLMSVPADCIFSFGPHASLRRWVMHCAAEVLLMIFFVFRWRRGDDTLDAAELLLAVPLWSLDAVFRAPLLDPSLPASVAKYAQALVLTRRSERQHMERFNLTSSFTRILRLVSYFVISIHHLGCLYNWIGRSRRPPQKQFPYWSMHAVTRGSVIRQWAHSFYWALTVSLGNDLVPTTLQEVLFSTLTQFIGLMLQTIIIGAIASLVSHKDMSATQQEERKYAISNFLKEHNVDLKLATDIMEYHKYSWSIRHDDVNNLFHDLPKFLSMKLQVSLRRGFIQNCHVFAQLDVRSRLRLVAKLTPRIAVPTEKITFQGQRGSKMGFVARGSLSVEVINQLTGAGLRLADLFRGDEYGSESVTGGEYSSTVESITFSELLELTRSDFLDVSEHNPEMRSAMVRIAHNRKIIISLGHKLRLLFIKLIASSIFITIFKRFRALDHYDIMDDAISYHVVKQPSLGGFSDRFPFWRPKNKDAQSAAEQQRESQRQLRTRILRFKNSYYHDVVAIGSDDDDDDDTSDAGAVHDAPSRPAASLTHLSRRSLDRRISCEMLVDAAGAGDPEIDDILAEDNVLSGDAN